MSECKEQWDQQMFEENESELLKNCQKAELIAKRVKKKGQFNNDKAKKVGDTQYSREARFQSGQEAML